MDELVKIFVDWAKKKKRWPLLFLLVIFPAFYFTKKFFTLSFNETITYWSFLIASGVIIVLSEFFIGSFFLKDSTTYIDSG